MTPAEGTLRIAVVGSGAIGQFYAAQLSLAGHEIRLLARRDASVLASRGIVVHQTPSTKIRSSLDHPLLQIEPSRLIVSTDPAQLAERGYPDWVLVALKTTALQQARALVAPLVGDGTRIAVLCNGLGVEDHFAGWFGPERVFGLICFVGVNRDEDGTIRHLAFGHVSLGHFQDNSHERECLRRVLEGAGIECEIPESLLEARWRKLGWNLPFNGLCLLYDCTTDEIVTQADRRAFALELSRESIRIGNLDLAAHGIDRIPWARTRRARCSITAAGAR